MSVANYMNKVKIIVDDLFVIGHRLRTEDIIAHTLNGIGDDFKELKASVRFRDTPITFEDFYDKLLDEELIHKQHINRNDDLKITAQYSNKRGNNFYRISIGK
ncbi:hypothetical protein KSP39_PZI012896 [Platanthera zijinensis]|uniref:Uncharacterized protein n=1 Tax=Platanthera zijinensis TaxID=2320716 RepID=A0AAP0BBC9_9ASPA